MGLNADHSWADGPVVSYLIEYLVDLEHRLGYQSDGHCTGYKDFSKATPLPRPLHLSWDLSPACVERIDSALEFALEQIADLDLYFLKHDDFGKGVMKCFKISPDAFIQMALQMAYFKVNQQLGRFSVV